MVLTIFGAAGAVKPNTDAYKKAVVTTLQNIGNEAQTVGSEVIKLITK